VKCKGQEKKESIKERKEGMEGRKTAFLYS
jgi:hypothetical protein